MNNTLDKIISDIFISLNNVGSACVLLRDELTNVVRDRDNTYASYEAEILKLKQELKKYEQ